MIKIDNLNPIEIQKAGYDALVKSLGVAGYIRFMQQFDKGHGDYTKERIKKQNKLSIKEITEEIKKMRK